MGRLIISENTTLDGVVEDPTGEEGTACGGWFTFLSDADRQAWSEAGLAEALSASAFLLGRRSDEYFGVRWRQRTGPWADRLNTMPKYVVSSTLQMPVWSHTTILHGDLLTEITRLKAAIDGDIVLVGSTQLARALWAHDLVDELRLKIFPVVAGGGARLFDVATRKTLHLTGVKPLGESLSFLTYERGT